MNITLKYILTALTIFLIIMVATFVQVYYDYAETDKKQRVTVTDITKVVESHVMQTVTQSQHILDLVAELIMETDNPETMLQPSRFLLLQTYCRSLVGCNSLSVINPSGTVVANSHVNGRANIDVSDRLYFKEATRTKKLFIGPAIITRTPGNPILFSIARPVFNSDGKLTSVIVVGINTNQVTDFYGLMGFGVSPTVSIFKKNADLVARYPNMKDYVGTNIINGPLFKQQLPKRMDGTFKSNSALDGKTRIAAYRSIPELDLVVFAGIEQSTAFLDWRNRTKRTVSIMASVLLFIMTGFYFLYKIVGQRTTLTAKNRDLNILVYLDSLTGIANRRTFDKALPVNWSNYQQSKQQFSLMMIDIDFFKQYNDKYGHQAGDACLKQVAKAISSCVLREIDLAARYGGEEFAVILNNSDSMGAIMVADRICKAVQALQIPHEASDVGQVVTISIGVATSNQTKTLDGLVPLADKALYQAKEAGRNRVNLY